MVILALLIIGIVSLIVIFGAPKWSSLPHILDGAVCVLNERDIRCLHPIALHGKPDQLFRTKDGLYVLVDTKKRDQCRVFTCDQVQLSVYAFILRRQGHIIHPDGFIRIPFDDGRVAFLPVKLLSDETILKLHKQFLDIKSGRLLVNCTCGNH